MPREPEYGGPYLDPWGWIRHGEDTSIEVSNVDNNYRRRGFTNTLSITGVLQYFPDVGTIREQKDSLIETFNSMRESQSNFLPFIGSNGLFPYLPENVIYEPVSLSFSESSLIDYQQYTAQFVLKITPTDEDIDERLISFKGLNFWDGSTVATSVEIDESTGKVTRLITISASIQCPDDMSWNKALEFYNNAASLEDVPGIQSISYDQNYDQQTISYSITDKDESNNANDLLGTMTLFGLSWSLHGSLQITNNDPAIPVSMQTLKSKTVDNANIPFFETLSYSLSLTAPDDIGFGEVDPDKVPLTLVQLYANARTVRPGQYLPGLTFSTFNEGNWISIADQDPNNLWEIITSEASLDIRTKSLQVSITARRSRNTSIIISKGIGSGSAFLWEKCNFSYSSTSDATSFLFTDTINISADIQCPRDMNPIQARNLINDILSLRDFDNRYSGYKLLNKSGNFDEITQTGNFSLQFKKIDIYDFFDESGNIRSPRPCLWDYDVFGGVNGIQLDVNYSESADIDREGLQVQTYTVTANFRQDPDNYTPGASNIEQAINNLWEKYVRNKFKLDFYRLQNGTRDFSSQGIEGTITLTFTDDGTGSDNLYEDYIIWYGIKISEPQYSFPGPLKRFVNISDNFSDGDIAQDNGFAVLPVTLSGKILPENHGSLINNTLYSDINYQNGFVFIDSYFGRLTSLNITTNPITRSSTISATIEAQPRNFSNQLAVPGYDPVGNLGAIPKA